MNLNSVLLFMLRELLFAAPDLTSIYAPTALLALYNVEFGGITIEQALVLILRLEIREHFPLGVVILSRWWAAI